MNLGEFKNPGKFDRPAPFWSWNDKLNEPELRRQITQMAEKGWGGFFMHSRVGLVTGYLSDEWMELVKACADEAEKRGLLAWLYDEDKWPSGFAGGRVSSVRDFRSRALVLLKEGEETEDDTVLASCTHGGEDYVIAKRISPLGDKWFNGACYVDLMNPEAVAAFIDQTHEKYKRTCGKYFGNAIPGVFTDEPCYHMHSGYSVPSMPWSDWLPAFFSEQKGYEIEDNLEALFFDLPGYQKVRYDFFDSATRLFIESFTKQYYDWCDKNNLLMTGHFMAENTLTYQTSWVGAVMPHYEFMHWPGIDKLYRDIGNCALVKQLSSVSDQLGKERAFCEAFAGIGQQSSFFHRKWIADWQAALGINYVNHHLSHYSMRGERKRDYPPNFFYQQPWWDEEKEFSDYLARLSHFGATGKRQVDILVIHPLASAWCEYTATDKAQFKGRIYDDKFIALSDELAANRLDFHYGDAMIMERHAKVLNGRIHIGGHSYGTVIIPATCALSSAVVSILTEFAAAAGEENILMCAPFPNLVDGVLSEDELFPRARRFADIGGVINAADERYPERPAVTDKLTGRPCPFVFTNERVSDEGRFILFVNTAEKREIDARISVKSDALPYTLDLAGGGVYKIPARREGDRLSLSLRFYPAGSFLLFLPSDEISAPPVPEVLAGGVSFCKGRREIFEIENLFARPLEENVLRLDTMSLWLGGECIIRNKPNPLAWHDAFYAAAEGTPFKAEYCFEAREVPEGDMYAVIEMAENLGRITLNGAELRPEKSAGFEGAFDPETSWKDVNFTRVLLEGVKTGTNVLAIEGEKHNNITGIATHSEVEAFSSHRATEAETAYIIGDFEVGSQNKTDFWIKKRGDNPPAAEITTKGYPFYAGAAEICCVLRGDCGKGRLWLRLNDANFASARVFVNGKDCGVRYWQPAMFDITGMADREENEIKVVIRNTLFNALGPAHVIDGLENRETDPRRMVDMNNYSERVETVPFGVGSISLLTV